MGYLPALCFVNGVVNGYFGLFVCNLEIIWLQHAITVVVSGVHLLCLQCMDERALILQKETAVMAVDDEEAENEDIHQQIDLVKTNSNRWRPKIQIKRGKGQSVSDHDEEDEDVVFAL